MPDESSVCLGADTLFDYRAGTLAPDRRAMVEAHLRGCENCRKQLAELPADPPRLPTDPPAELLTLTGYEDIELLGQGGMGEVYRATNTILGRPEVLKLIRRKWLDDPLIVRRFKQEIQAAARLNNPYVVTAYQAYQSAGGLVLAMEYVNGESLDKTLQRGPLGVSEACRCALHAALGLQHAHTKGLVHRDIKPHNLIRTLDDHGELLVKILDFGYAKVTSEQRAGEGLTTPSTVFGTAAYMAPEQARKAAAADIRADVYALGCTLFHLLTGQKPYSGGSDFEVLLAHMNDEVPAASTIRPEVPADVSAVVQRMMAKQPAARYQTPAEVVSELKPFISRSVNVAQNRSADLPARAGTPTSKDDNVFFSSVTAPPTAMGQVPVVPSVGAPAKPVFNTTPSQNAPLPEPIVVIERSVDIPSHPVLRSHVLDGRAVLPMAVHMEWLAHTALHGNPGLVFHGFNDLRITSGVIVEKGLPTALRLMAGKAVKQDKLFVVPVEVRSRRRDGREVIHSRAEVVLTAALPKAPTAGNVPDLQPYPQSLADSYQYFLFHGPDLHGIESVDGCGETAFVGTAYPAPAPAEWFTSPLRASWVADPLMLDAAFQMMILWSFFRYGAGSLPCFLGRYRQYRRTLPAGPTKVNIRITRDNGSFARAEIDFLDGGGNLVAQVQDYECVIDPMLNQAFRRNQL